MHSGAVYTVCAETCERQAFALGLCVLLQICVSIRTWEEVLCTCVRWHMHICRWTWTFTLFALYIHNTCRISMQSITHAYKSKSSAGSMRSSPKRSLGPATHCRWRSSWHILCTCSRSGASDPVSKQLTLSRSKRARQDLWRHHSHLGTREPGISCLQKISWMSPYHFLKKT